MRASILSLLIVAALVAAQTQYTATAAASVAKARATAKTLSPTSHVAGKTFDRFVTIWLENTDYDAAAGDSNIAWIASKGITLSNFLSLTHPSQPNYIGSVSGATHGVADDDYHRIDSSVRTIVDLLDSKKVSWGVYGQDSPYSGFEGTYVNQETGANDYVRKHNPLVSYDSVTSVENRLAKMKNLTMFYEDLDNNKLPQWMFITPNMTNDGHDTSVTTAAKWTRSFLAPLLTNSNFMNNTLVQLTFDECETYTITNKVFTVLLGDAVPTSQEGTTDDTSYDHYSALRTVERNWKLGHLGQADASATPFY